MKVYLVSDVYTLDGCMQDSQVYAYTTLAYAKEQREFLLNKWKSCGYIWNDEYRCLIKDINAPENNISITIDEIEIIK